MTGLGMGSVPSGTLSLVAADVASDAAACASVTEEHDACAVDADVLVVVSISSSVCITKLGLADFSAQNADLCTAFYARKKVMLQSSSCSFPRVAIPYSK